MLTLTLLAAEPTTKPLTYATPADVLTEERKAEEHHDFASVVDFIAAASD